MPFFWLIGAFVCLPLLTVFLLIQWAVTGRKILGKRLGQLWLCVAAIAGYITIVHVLTDPKNVDRNDVYGQYVIDRSIFPGPQADWQYDHFRFEITKDNRFIFYRTEKEKIISAWQGEMGFLPAYVSPRLVIYTDSAAHHIIDPEPTLYHTTWSFYYVFHSPLFGNVFFTKGRWKPRH